MEKQIRTTTIKKIAAYFFSIIFLLLIWNIFAKIINAELILPYPCEVCKVIGKLIITSVFWKNFLLTFLRCIISFLITMILGFVIGFLCGIFPFCKDFFEFPISIIRVTPVVAFILIALFWFKSGTVPIFVSILMTLPIVITSVISGLSSSDDKLLAMAKCFNLSNKNIFCYIKFPASIPYLLNGAVSAFGLTWKVVVAGEVLSLPSLSVGTLLQKNQVHLETSYVLAITIILVIISFVIQKLFSMIVKSVIKKRGL